MKKNPDWWTLRSWKSVAYYFARAIGRSAFDDAPWLVDFLRLSSTFWRGMNTKEGRLKTKKIGKLLCDAAEEREAFEAVYRLHGHSSETKRWCLARIAPPKEPPKTLAERTALARVAMKRKAEKREQHARAMLAKHERAMAREEVAVARWRRKVAAYDRRRNNAT